MANVRAARGNLYSIAGFHGIQKLESRGGEIPLTPIPFRMQRETRTLGTKKKARDSCFLAQIMIITTSNGGADSRRPTQLLAKDGYRVDPRS